MRFKIKEELLKLIIPNVAKRAPQKVLVKRVPTMNNTENNKITQITEDTLIVGVNIGSTTHYARAFNGRCIEGGKVYRCGELVQLLFTQNILYYLLCK